MKTYLFSIISLLLLTLPLWACSGYSATGGPGKLVKSPLSTEASSSFKPLKLNEIGILPVENASLVRKVDTQDSKAITSELYQAFASKSSLELKLLEPTKLNATLKERALKAGSNGKVQGVLVGLISGGEPLSNNKEEYKPIQFELRLFDRSKKEIVWSAFYVSGNQPLTDNLYKISEKAKQNFKYQSSSQALREGFEAAALELEKLRVTSFQAN